MLDKGGGGGFWLINKANLFGVGMLLKCNAVLVREVAFLV